MAACSGVGKIEVTTNEVVEVKRIVHLIVGNVAACWIGLTESCSYSYMI
jgi:hypothetical protein